MTYIRYTIQKISYSHQTRMLLYQIITTRIN
uniref:Uncharacterized protein n=1 Tax=virus sp. ctBM815 TaxID=2825806 RepID=A0A8S5RL25_9VIRU|nr:MAG TPA: hypothetical protein [virus sp. ctBM815]